MGRIAAEAGLHGVVKVMIEASLNMYVIQIQVIGSAGQQLANGDDTCDLCSLEEARNVVGRAAGNLLGDLAIGGIVRLDVTPANARVMIDGEETSESQVELPAGSHRMVFSAEGFVTEERNVQVGAGEEVTVTVALERVGGGEDVRPPDPVRPVDDGLGPLGISGVVLTAAGGLMASAGIALVVIDDNCAGGRTDLNGQCEFIYSTMAAGAALLAVGGISLVAGIVLLVLDRRRRRSAETEGSEGGRVIFAPSFAMGPDGSHSFAGALRLLF
jgi:hypothetical protein